jgi:hypothetical protein
VFLSLRGFFLLALLLAKKPWQSHNLLTIKYISWEIATPYKQEAKQNHPLPPPKEGKYRLAMTTSYTIVLQDDNFKL